MNRLCDTHVHVFDPSRFPYVPLRKFTPGTANVQQLQKHLKTIDADSVVLVQPSVYGTDHRCLLNALGILGPKARGIAVIDQTTCPNEIKLLNQSGVVGARINTVVNREEGSKFALAAIQHLESNIPNHWHIQLHVNLNALETLADHIAKSSRYFVLDHLGLPDVTNPLNNQHWQLLLDIVRTGKLYVKVSAPYLSSERLSPYEDLKPFIESLIHTNSERLLWGTNWPHTKGTQREASTSLAQIENFRDEDDVQWRDKCVAWSTQHHAQLTFSNAHSLYFK